MLLQKLFRLLVLGGAMLGGASAGCAGQAQTPGPDKKTDAQDAGQDSSAATTQPADGGADAGASGGGGVIGW